MHTYQTKGTCSRQINFDVDSEGRLNDVSFIGGCHGNLQAVSKLVEGKSIDEVISMLKGIQCRNNTSCADQLANALIKYKEQNNL